MKMEESNLLRHPMTDEQWTEATGVLSLSVKSMDGTTVRALVESIFAGIQRIDPLMTAYCLQTCPSCSDPCCRGQDIYYNQADVLYLTALGDPVPPGQTRSSLHDPCRYLGPNGCVLPRTVRPYVCAWYLCESHMDLFSDEPAGIQRSVVDTLRAIRFSRLSLEMLHEKEPFGTRNDRGH